MQTTVELDGGRTIRLIGTAHVSQPSVDEVREAIAGDGEAPDRVCVELDEDRYANLKQGWGERKIRCVLIERKGFLLLTNMVLYSFQRRLGQDLGVQPGAEMAAVVDAAKGLYGQGSEGDRDECDQDTLWRAWWESSLRSRLRLLACGQEAKAGLPDEIVLCDRKIQVTLRRAWRESSLRGRLRLLAALLDGAFSKNDDLDSTQVEALKEKGALQSMIEELAGYLPQAKEVLIDERDRYLANRIFTAGGKRVVAVVGAGRVSGIERRLLDYRQQKPTEQETKQELEKLDQEPPSRWWARLLPWTVPALFVALVGYGFLRAGAEVTVEKLGQWVLVNGTLAALGALAVLAHPVTIIASFVAAPITSVNPTIGAGIVAGLVQALVREPRVKDFENLWQDVTSVRGILRNRVTHVLAVFIMTSVGSAVGTFVGLSFLTSLLRGGG